MFIGTLPDMFIGTLPGMLGLQQKREGGEELWNEVLNLLSSKILCCFLLMLFHPCCAPLRPPVPLHVAAFSPLFLFMWCLYTALEMSLACVPR
ncbi:hypothetical protein RchiOBHm_Chr6g0281041 [Rosa chinensis]|uniref:Uncharacterized protein n=1 Tax=Rosa chinensis TaxID=74649 RepID=A0A2P6PTF4_ROSCH|nr:hypothetical protein RchiOBHm_Chr6g0281041 [Rosa chinensis]